MRLARKSGSWLFRARKEKKKKKDLLKKSDINDILKR